MFVILDHNSRVMKQIQFNQLLPRIIILFFLIDIGCSGFDTGPSLVVDVSQMSLEPTLGNSTLCCCRVVGNVINHSTIAVHVTLKFEAFEKGKQEPIATAVDFLDAVEPNESRSFSAAGFARSCGSIDKFLLADKDMRAVRFGP